MEVECDAYGCVDGYVTCQSCQGSGDAFGILGGPECPHCGGTGEQPCEVCGGTGKIYLPN